jgi:signal transduction histidine kinase
MEREYFYADQLRLNQIYINILSNAIKYTEPGGSVSVDMREEASEKSGCMKMTYRVCDSGIGMSPEFMENMYQPFSRQIDSRVNSIQGTGLGLAITKSAILLHRGVIKVTSNEGEGSVFMVRIPIVHEE